MTPMLVVAALLQAAQPAAAQPAPAQGTRLVITPAEPVVVAEDTLRLQARVVDASGQPVSAAQIRFVAAGGVFEGRVDPDGLVRSGSTGTLPVTVVAQIPGFAALTQRVEVRMVPGPAATITVDAPTRMVAGQRVVLAPLVKSAGGDVRRDRVTWTSSNPAAVSVNADGLVEAKAMGRATLSGRVDRA
ncbi:MAG TPA: Ig-like domain-containing protein, partial [Gemmatimonas sp.]|uniref:Ig-like domain-containing protein n=1 Tax=Gemmatimonas sp. TaxID=1962908 RepID=UPI002EDA647A